MTREQFNALKALCDTVIESVPYEPEVCGEGPMYAAMSPAGISLEMFNSIIRICVGSGKIKKVGSHGLTRVK